MRTNISGRWTLRREREGATKREHQEKGAPFTKVIGEKPARENQRVSQEMRSLSSDEGKSFIIAKLFYYTYTDFCTCISLYL